MSKVNKLFFALTIFIGVVFAALTWIPVVSLETVFSDYTTKELDPVSGSIMSMAAVGCFMLLAFAGWNTFQLYRRSQVLVSKGILQNSINLILLIVEVFALGIVFAVTPANKVETLYIVPIIPVALSVVYWAVCTFVLKPNK